MKLTRAVFGLVFVLALGGRAFAQQAATGEEHKRLAKLAGEWEVVGEGSTGTSVYKMVLGGMWLESSFKGTFGGVDFEGKGLDTYDAAKKKYVSIWCDSMSATPMILEGNYDKEGKKLIMEGDGVGPDGSAMKFKSVTEYSDDNTMTFSLSGNDQEMVKLTYKRKKPK